MSAISGISNAIEGSVVNRYTYHFNSQRADIASSSTPACEFRLSQPITLSEPGTTFEAYITSAIIPYTFYQFSTLRNSTTINYTITAGGSGSFSFVIPDGNYNIKQLASIFSSTLQVQLIANGFTSVSLTSQYNSPTNRLRFNLVNSSLLTIQVASSRLSTALGFSSNWVLSTSVTYTTSDIDCNIAPINTLFVTSTTISDPDAFDQLRSANTSSLVIATIPIIHSPKYYIPFQPENPLRTRFSNPTISVLQFDLIDNFGDYIKNFPVAWTFSLVVEEIRINKKFQQIEDIPAPFIDPLEVLRQEALDNIDQLSDQITESNLKKRKNV
jgi:hypothetical protein